MRIKVIISLIGLSIISTVSGNSEPTGYLSGQVFLEDSWKPELYISFIEDFDAMHTMSNQMILHKAPIEPDGKFFVNLDFLPKSDHLYRIHFVKKGDPPATIIIGGNEENHLFFIANRYSEIEIFNTSENSSIQDIYFKNSPVNTSFQEIRDIELGVLNTSFSDSGIKQEFIQKALYEKYRYVADTCNHNLLSLYAIYKSRYESNYQINQGFYDAYLKKWEDDESDYFKAFRATLPVAENSNSYLYYGLIALGCLTIGFFAGRIRKQPVGRSRNPISKLSVQERKVFQLLQQGASNQDIAEAHHIGINTVKSHVSSIYGKLNIKSRKEAMNYNPFME